MLLVLVNLREAYFTDPAAASLYVCHADCYDLQHHVIRRRGDSADGPDGPITIAAFPSCFAISADGMNSFLYFDRCTQIFELDECSL